MTEFNMKVWRALAEAKMPLKEEANGAALDVGDWESIATSSVRVGRNLLENDGDDDDEDF